MQIKIVNKNNRVCRTALLSDCRRCNKIEEFRIEVTIYFLLKKY